ncbi:MAG: hypothetical protein RLN62_07055 [Rickettsiales bacterium]
MQNYLKGAAVKDCQDVYDSNNPSDPIPKVDVGVTCTSAGVKGKYWLFWNLGPASLGGDPVEVTCGRDNKSQNVTTPHSGHCKEDQSVQMVCLAGNTGYCGGMFSAESNDDNAY